MLTTNVKFNISNLGRYDIHDYLYCLSHLSQANAGNNVTAQFFRMGVSETYHVFVAKLSNIGGENTFDAEREPVIGCASLFIERKLSYDGCQVGHIEDVVVLPDYRGNGVAMSLVNHCIEEAKRLHCRKVLLDCNREKVSFYRKLGFRENGVAMRLDLNTNASEENQAV